MSKDSRPAGISRRGLFKVTAGLLAGATGITALPKRLMAADRKSVV